MGLRSRHGWLCVLLLLAAPEAECGQAVLRGTVVSATTGQAVAGATVGAEGSEVSTTTDDAGRFALKA
jgi:ABC-type arginine/histidine transport system permease subunit